MAEAAEDSLRTAMAKEWLAVRDGKWRATGGKLEMKPVRVFAWVTAPRGHLLSTKAGGLAEAVESLRGEWDADAGDLLGEQMASKMTFSSNEAPLVHARNGTADATGIWEKIEALEKRVADGFLSVRGRWEALDQATAEALDPIHSRLDELADRLMATAEQSHLDQVEAGHARRLKALDEEVARLRGG